MLSWRSESTPAPSGSSEVCRKAVSTAQNNYEDIPEKAEKGITLEEREPGLRESITSKSESRPSTSDSESETRSITSRPFSCKVRILTVSWSSNSCGSSFMIRGSSLTRDEPEAVGGGAADASGAEA